MISNKPSSAKKLRIPRSFSAPCLNTPTLRFKPAVDKSRRGFLCSAWNNIQRLEGLILHIYCVLIVAQGAALFAFLQHNVKGNLLRNSFWLTGWLTGLPLIAVVASLIGRNQRRSKLDLYYADIAVGKKNSRLFQSQLRALKKLGSSRRESPLLTKNRNWIGSAAAHRSHRRLAVALHHGNGTAGARRLLARRFCCCLPDLEDTTTAFVISVIGFMSAVVCVAALLVFRKEGEEEFSCACRFLAAVLLLGGFSFCWTSHDSAFPESCRIRN